MTSSHHTKAFGDGLRFAVRILLGGKCATRGCGVRYADALMIDHIHGGGRKHYARTGFNRWYFVTILHDIAAGRRRKYQLLCGTHHLLKSRKEQRQAGKYGNAKRGRTQ